MAPLAPRQLHPGQYPAAMAINILLLANHPSSFQHYPHFDLSTTLKLSLYSSVGITSESSCTSPIDTDNDKPFEPDFSETDLTEPECSPPLAGRTIARKKLSPSPGTKSLLVDPSNVERVPEDYGRSNKTKKLKLRLKERWAWFC
ncbi:hypothetical protein N7507_005028 [Penicillium longicatenatum]|nr:hypothetical protein N7507_005028 [Penicillium longicatenatum]